MSAASQASLGGARILAVEDDFVVLLEIATTLREAGAATVRTCGTIEQALQNIETETFDVALLDVRVGHDNIGAVAHKLEQLGTPFVFYTGQVTPKGVVPQWPEARIVTKPAQAATIVSELLSAMQSSAVARARDQ